MEHLAGMLAILCVFGVPLSAIWTNHNRKMMELKLRLNNHADGGLRAELDALRQEVRSLRDTSTQYDLSFDTALQRMERRVEGIERKVLSGLPEDNMQTLGRR